MKSEGPKKIDTLHSQPPHRTTTRKGLSPLILPPPPHEGAPKDVLSGNRTRARRPSTMVIKSSFGTSHVSLLTTPGAHAASRNEAIAVVQLARLNRTLELSSALDNGRARLFVAVYDGKHRESKAFLYMDADNREHEVVDRASPTAVHKGTCGRV